MESGKIWGRHPEGTKNVASKSRDAGRDHGLLGALTTSLTVFVRVRMRMSSSLRLCAHARTRPSETCGPRRLLVLSAPQHPTQRGDMRTRAPWTCEPTRRCVRISASNLRRIRPVRAQFRAHRPLSRVSPTLGAPWRSWRRYSVSLARSP